MMIYRFGIFALDTENFELSRDGVPVAVEPQVFNLLLLLIENRDRVVGRAELIERVWGGRIVSDAALSSRISSARRALGDNGSAQAMIRTVPRRGFRFMGGVATEPTVGTPSDTGGVGAAPPAPDPLSVAVLPLRSLGDDDADERLCDGLSEDIVTELSRFRDIRVIAAKAGWMHQGGDADRARLSAELGARYLVEGSLRRAGDHLHVSVQLVDAASGQTLWAERLEPEIENVVAVHNEVPRILAATLSGRVQEAALERALRRSPAELDAYDCLLRARPFRTLLNATSHAEARDHLERAVVLDPNSAPAHALLANAYLAEHRLGLNPRPDPVGRALTTAETAVHLDPQNAYARCWLGIVHFFRGENHRFEAETDRALTLNPNDPEILADIGHYRAFLGDFARGTELTRRAQQLNPLHPGWYHFSLARRHYHEEQYGDVLADVQRIGMPEFYWTHLLDAAAYGRRGDPRADSSLSRVFALRPQFDARAELRKWNAAPDDEAHILDGLKSAGLRV